MYKNSVMVTRINNLENKLNDLVSKYAELDKRIQDANTDDLVSKYAKLDKKIQDVNINSISKYTKPHQNTKDEVEFYIDF